MNLADHTRQLVAYNEWANNRILDAAAKLSEERYAQVAGTLTHLLGTQRYWYDNWTHAEREEIAPPTLDAMRDAYAASHDEMRAFFANLTDDDWQRAEPWWKRWGYEQTLPLGETLFQVVNHSTQHRSEIAIVTSLHGASSGDLDYLVFKQQGLA
jgi:uncharacterized damage-inducible protein DinB